jgi:hypothetical protein
MKTRLIHTKFWKDEYVASLAVPEKLFFIYLLTNEKINIAGVYELTPREMQFDLDIEIEELNEIKKKLQLDKKVYFFGNWVAIVNAQKYQQYTGIKNQTCMEKELSYAPKELLEKIFKYPTDRLSAETDSIRNKKLEIRNTKEEINNGVGQKEFQKIREKLAEEKSF